MKSIDFTEAQKTLASILNSRFMNEVHDADLERRAQNVVARWWANPKRPTVVIGHSGAQVVGCELAFELGQIRVKKWLTKFLYDVHEVHLRTKNAVALGYANDYQLFIAKVNGIPNLAARKGFETLYWRTLDHAIPPQGSPLRIALDRARSLGYLDYLKGLE